MTLDIWEQKHTSTVYLLFSKYLITCISHVTSQYKNKGTLEISFIDFDVYVQTCINLIQIRF